MVVYVGKQFEIDKVDGKYRILLQGNGCEYYVGNQLYTSYQVITDDVVMLYSNNSYSIYDACDYMLEKCGGVVLQEKYSPVRFKDTKTCIQHGGMVTLSYDGTNIAIYKDMLVIGERVCIDKSSGNVIVIADDARDIADVSAFDFTPLESNLRLMELPENVVVTFNKGYYSCTIDGVKVADRFDRVVYNHVDSVIVFFTSDKLRFTVVDVCDKLMTLYDNSLSVCQSIDYETVCDCNVFSGHCLCYSDKEICLPGSMIVSRNKLYIGSECYNHLVKAYGFDDSDYVDECFCVTARPI